ncbi:TolC family protein [Anaeromyxobacter dehalogenans]|uniref:Outer membrane efflux protein n=1 Tax=Anaeromyxobacter dehalogenans (strain 2CP-C) TaxID=290397 RepID=Q2IDS9_ANADE|nr:TolC family protein [Anaeromyxobacter dehalogenans]ABC82739.1 outer membrane efflux protein [Anaeromyxobacter dehalogenans 2CP-C]
MTTVPRLAAVLLLAPALALGQAAPPAPPADAAPPAPDAPARRVITLEEAVRTARAHQPQLRSARAATDAALARADQARAPLLPQLTGSAGLGRTTDNFAGKPGGASWSTSGTFDARAVLSQTLLDLGQLARWRAAGASADAQRASERATELDVVAGAQSAFFVARAAHALVRVARETLDNQEAHLRQVEAFVQVGTRPAIDLAQARADRATAQVQLVRAGNSYENARALLAQAIGLEWPADIEPSDEAIPPVPGEDGPLAPLVAEASRARPELASLEAQRRAGALSLDAARAEWLPTLSAQTGVSDAGTRPDADGLNWSATLNLGWNLLEGGGSLARAREARANLAGVDAQETALRTQITVDVDAARQGVQTARAASAAADEALVNARERLRLAEGRYQAGAGSIIELGDAQVAATSAGAQVVQAEYDLAAARARLLRALGRG